MSNVAMGALVVCFFAQEWEEESTVDLRAARQTCDILTLFIQRSQGRSLHLFGYFEGRGLVLIDTEFGLMERWNRDRPRNMRAIKNGDIIVSVNGAQAAIEMDKELCSARDLILIIWSPEFDYILDNNVG